MQASEQYSEKKRMNLMYRTIYLRRSDIYLNIGPGLVDRKRVGRYCQFGLELCVTVHRVLSKLNIKTRTLFAKQQSKIYFYIKFFRYY